MLDYLKKKLENNVDDFVLLKSVDDVSHIKFAENKIVKTGTESLSTISIFVSKDKKIVSTSLKDLSRSSADRVLKQVFNYLKLAKPNMEYEGIAKGPFKYKKIEKGYDRKIKELDEVDIVESGINAALENSKRTSGIFESSVGNMELITSGDVKAHDEVSTVYFSIRALNSSDASGHKTSSARVLSDFNVEGVSRKAGEVAKMAKDPSPGRAGVFDMVIDPLPMADLIGSVGESASVYNVEAGMSFFENKLGETLGNFNLIDNGRLQGGIASSSFDGEGVPTQKTKIVDNGVLKTYLHNTSTSKRYNVKTTANAGLISPDPSNLSLEGDVGNPFDIKNGIYVTNLWYTRFQNYATGDFSTIPRDGMFLIEDGEITKPIKNLRISENMLNLLKNIEIFDDKVEQITSWEASTPVTTSNVLIKDVKFTKPVA